MPSSKQGPNNFSFFDLPRALWYLELTSNVAVVLQETELFNFSLRENITMMREVPAGLLERSLEIASLDAVIAQLPDGLETLIGERGYTLSGGERQRVGIARAICRNS